MDKVDKLLLRVGVPVHMSGYRYIYRALELLEKDPSYIAGAISSRLYPEIGAEHGVSGVAVERCIRHAIEAAFDRMPPELQEELFGNTVAARRGKATNKEFLMVFLLHLRGEEDGKREAVAV